MRLILIHQESATDSIFKKTEKVLSNTEYQAAIELVASRKDVGKYRSVTDFLCCELFPAYRYHCFKYYDEEGPQIKDLLTQKRLQFMDDYISMALVLAYEIKKQDIHMSSWTQFMETVEGYALLEAA